MHRSWRTWLLVCWLGIAGTPLPAGEPTNPREFQQARIIDVWQKYGHLLTFGRGQTLALVDDGCKPDMPEWSTPVDGREKVLVRFDAVDGDDDPRHEGRGYHGSTIGIPSSLNYQGKWGVAPNNQVAIIRGLECCHCKVADSVSLAVALRWIVANHAKYRITTVNLAPVDDLAHDEPVPSEIDEPLRQLRAAQVWVSAPAGNHNFTNGISWPACQPGCFAIGAVRVGRDEIYLDRHDKIDLLVPAAATSSSNAIVCGSVMILREAIERVGYDWRRDGPTLPEAMLAILQRTGVPVADAATGRTFRRLDLLAAIEQVDPQPARREGAFLSTPQGNVAIFPADNPWNTPIDQRPVHPDSRQLIESIGLEKGLHPDFGTVWNNAPSGIPFCLAKTGQALVPIEFEYADESDPGPYPIPTDAPIEGGKDAKGDRHILVIDPAGKKLYELFSAYPTEKGWRAGSGAIWDLTSNRLRPAGWTSADAAGLPIFPGLVRYDEVVERREIPHALRFTVRRTRRAYVHPATHWASRSDDPSLPPMGLRVRLRSDFDESPFPDEAQVILRALKRYGMLLADNGGDWFISGAPDPRWNDERIATLKRVKGRDLEVVDTGPWVVSRSAR